MNKFNKNYLMSLLISLSMLFYSIRGKVGAIMTTICIFSFLPYLIKNKNDEKNISSYYALFIFFFAIILGIVRAINVEYYLFVGYFAAVFILTNSDIDVYKYIWDILGKIAIFEAIGVFMQRFLPNVYYWLISIVLPSGVVSSIKHRLTQGYYTGFTREVSYTMFFIVIGIGIYLFDILKDDNKKIDLQKYKKQKYLKIAILGVALFISGKRATLVFCLLSIFIIQLITNKKLRAFIKSIDIPKFIKKTDISKLIEYISIGVITIIFIKITYPVWSKISTLARIAELFNFIGNGNVGGLTNGRIQIYKDAINLWTTNPIFGIGWGNFKYMTNNSLWYSGFDVHNCFLQILCETGLIGAIIFCTLTVKSVKNSIKCIKMSKEYSDKQNYRLAITITFIQIFFIIYSLTEPILYEYTDYIIYFISINITELLLLKLEKKYN